MPCLGGTLEFGSVVRGDDGVLRVFGEDSIWTSSDGIRWEDTKRPWQVRALAFPWPVAASQMCRWSQPYKTDYPVSAFFNNVTKSWQMLARPRGSDRRVATHNLPRDLSGYSNDSLPQLALDTDGDDSPLAEFYGMFAFGYSGYFIAMLDVYHVPQGLTPTEIQANSPHKCACHPPAWIRLLC